MARDYIVDKDLEFLESISSENLSELVEYLIGAEENERVTEELREQEE